MSTLQVRGPDFSATKQKALEDAKKMQASVDRKCVEAGEESPPYLLNELIGKGSFGRVYKAVALKTKRQVAVKIIDIEGSDADDPRRADTFREFLAEISALKLLSESGARNINLVIEAMPVGQSMWMVTEHCAGGSVATLMKPTAPGGLQEKWVIPILREVAEAVHWVHREGIIHRDIKCANVLITEYGGVQLCDFGVAGVVESKFDKRSTFIGTLHWMAPELFDRSKAYGVEVDIWAFGALVFEIASGLPPNVMNGFDISELGNHLRRNAPRLRGDQYSEQLKSLVAYCLEEDPRQRPTIEQVQAHPYIFNTAQNYPTSSLTLLVRGYRMWESQGGTRKSLFAPGGAQGPLDISDLSSTALANDEWNFSTTLAFDQEVFQDPKPQAVFDVYGSNVDFALDEMVRPSKPKSRRRPPPQQLAAMKAPLEKVFDPNTISNYPENSRAYYGQPVPPPTSDLPLRDDSTQSVDVRESLIDLDASLHGGELSNFVDMNTIRAGEPRFSTDFYPQDGNDYNKPPLSDPADLKPDRRTRDWKFPSMAPPASANPEMSRFPFSEDRSGPSPNRPQLHHHPTDPVEAPNYGTGDLDDPVPRPGASSRESISSLIDLDMSMPDPTPEPTRPSTANSDAASVSGSDAFHAGPFDLERHASLYVPSSNREPSIYVSDDSDFASALPKDHDDFGNGFSGLAISDSSRPSSALSQHSNYRNHYHNHGSGSLSGNLAGAPPGLRLNTNNFSAVPDYPDSAEFLPTMQPSRRNRDAPLPGGGDFSYPTTVNGMWLPPLPAPPSSEAMQGIGDAEAVKEELRRLTTSMGEHLACMNQHLSSMAGNNSAYE